VAVRDQLTLTEQDWKELRETEDSKIIPLEKGRIFGCDIDEQAVKACVENLKLFGRQNFSKLVEVQQERLQVGCS
jgi:hypothetical protein